jgi:hypothetical protein
MRNNMEESIVAAIEMDDTKWGEWEIMKQFIVHKTMHVDHAGQQRTNKYTSYLFLARLTIRQQ